MIPILVLGYYGRQNLGDEMFKEAIPLLFSEKSEGSKVYQFTFKSTDDLKDPSDLSNYSHIIVGGGDLFNKYFLEKLSKFLRDFKGCVIGLSIGMPFDEFITYEYTSLFNHIFVRNKCHLDKLRLLMGSDKVHYLHQYLQRYYVHHFHIPAD